MHAAVQIVWCVCTGVCVVQSVCAHGHVCSSECVCTGVCIVQWECAQAAWSPRSAGFPLGVAGGGRDPVATDTGRGHTEWSVPSTGGKVRGRAAGHVGGNRPPPAPSILSPPPPHALLLWGHLTLGLGPALPLPPSPGSPEVTALHPQ